MEESPGRSQTGHQKKKKKKKKRKEKKKRIQGKDGASIIIRINKLFGFKVYTANTGW